MLLFSATGVPRSLPCFYCGAPDPWEWLTGTFHRLLSVMAFQPQSFTVPALMALGVWALLVIRV